MAEFVVRNLDEGPDQHKAMFLFTSRDLMYVVEESSYDRFEAAETASQRMQLADMVFDTVDGTVVKCRYF